MIQIIALRNFRDGSEKKYDKLVEIPVQIKSVEELFNGLHGILHHIPEKERWNLFYTVSNCNKEKRDFLSCSVIPFDIDGCKEAQLDSITSVVCSVLKVDHTKVGVVHSGNGLHVLVAIKKAITKKEDFRKLRPHYKELCHKINEQLKKAGLEGSADPSVFDPRRILRLPGTINRKPGKEEKIASLVCTLGEAQDWHLEDASGLPAVGKDEQVDKQRMNKFPRTEPAAVMEECLFLKQALEEAGKLNEPQWYAALSITARLEGGDKSAKEWSHEISKGHPGYSEEETDHKIEQALEASGPRTCESIGNIWEGCKECKHKGKITSPILIRSANSIATEFTGFHIHPISGRGKPIPVYEDLRKYFEREAPYIGLDNSGIVHAWNGRAYTPYGNLFIEEYAQKNFVPHATGSMVREFRTLVQRTNLRPMAWWQSTVKRKINFQNGYLDIDTMDFRPHTQEIGFRYVLPYDYSPQAKAPVFSKMLRSITGGDEGLQRVLLEFMGYALSSDDCWAQKALVLVGEGANGKSTLIKVLNELGGKGNYSCLTMDGINASEYNRQMLDGKLFNISEETPTKSMMNNSLFKSLTTGGEIQVRSPYKEPYFLENTAKLVFTCNELPDSQDNSFGYYRRLIIVPFSQKFTKDSPGFDPHISQKLMGELPGVFNMAMEGYKRLVAQQGFTDSKAVSETLEKYTVENDTVMFWVTENMNVYTNGGFEQHFTPLRELYSSYRFDTESLGRKPVNYQHFVRGLQRVLPDFPSRYSRQKTKEEGGYVRGLKGVGYHATV